MSASSETAGFVPSGEGRQLTVLGDRIACKVVGADTAGAWSLFEITSPPGAAVPLHRHAWEESYYVLEGELEFQLGSRAHRLPSGGLMRVKGGSSHGLRNVSQAPARYLLWASPAGTEAFFEELDVAAREDGFGLPIILAMAARHGIEVVAPSPDA